jgi:hypothetical protein
MTDFTVVHDTVFKVIWERFDALDEKMARLEAIISPKCHHEFTGTSMTSHCYHCGIRRSDVPQILSRDCNHFWHYPEPNSLPECKFCGVKTL